VNLSVEFLGHRPKLLPVSASTYRGDSDFGEVVRHCRNYARMSGVRPIEPLKHLG